MRTAVFFNIGWLSNYYAEIDLNNIYKDINEPPQY